MKATKTNIALALKNNDLNLFKNIFTHNKKEAIEKLCLNLDIYFNLFIPKTKNVDYLVRQEMLIFLESTPYVKTLYERHSSFFGLNFVMFSKKDNDYLSFLNTYFNSQYFSYFMNDSKNQRDKHELFINMAERIDEKDNYYKKLSQYFLHSKNRNEILSYDLLTEHSFVSQLAFFGKKQTLQDCLNEPSIVKAIKNSKSDYNLISYVTEKTCFDYLVNLFGRNYIYEQANFRHYSQRLEIIYDILNKYTPSNDKEKNLALTLIPDLVSSYNVEFTKIITNYAIKHDTRFFEYYNDENEAHNLFLKMYKLGRNDSLMYLIKTIPIEQLISHDKIIHLINTYFDANQVQKEVNQKLIGQLIKHKDVNQEIFDFTHPYKKNYKNIRLIDLMCLKQSDYYVQYLISKKTVNIHENSQSQKPEDYNIYYSQIFDKARMNREIDKLEKTISNIKPATKKIKI